MAIVPCAAGDQVDIQGRHVFSTDPAGSHDSVPASSQHAPALTLQTNHRRDNGTVMPAGFVYEFWLLSGRGAGAVEEVRMVRQQGPLASPVAASFTFDANAHLPVSNRPFNWTTDSFRYKYDGGQGLATDQGWNVDTLMCQGTASTDCCAEVLAKLDQVLTAVGKTYANQP